MFAFFAFFDVLILLILATSCNILQQKEQKETLTNSDLKLISSHEVLVVAMVFLQIYNYVLILLLEFCVLQVRLRAVYVLFYLTVPR